MQKYYRLPEKIYLQYLCCPWPPTLNISGADQRLLRASYEFQGTGARAFHEELLGLACHAHVSVCFRLKD